MGAPHRCTHPGCSKQFDRKYNLKCHLRIHSDEKPYRCTYSHCTRRFRWKSSLNHHLLSLDHTTRKERQERLRRRRQSRVASSPSPSSSTSSSPTSSSPTSSSSPTAVTAPNHHPPPPPLPPLPPLPALPVMAPACTASAHSPPATPLRGGGGGGGALFMAERCDGVVPSSALSFEEHAQASPVGILASPTDVMVDPFRSQPLLVKPHAAPPPLLAVFDDGAMAAPQLDALYQTLLF